MSIEPVGPGPGIIAGPAHWRELDLFRAIAATCMVLNHVAVRSPGVGSPVVAASELVGGVAPVLFYFATGLGYGVQSAARRPRGSGFLFKVGILLLAASDFFTFIGLSMLVLEVIRRSRRPEMLAGIVAGLAVAGRFAAGPVLRSTIDQRPGLRWLGDILGTGGGIGYPLSPWLAFPMFGFLVGRIAARRREVVGRLGWLPAGLVGAAIPFGLGSGVMVARGSILARYGSMNLAYFLAAIAALALVLALVVLAVRPARAAGVVGLVSLSGLRSFAVVPLQYLLIESLAAGPGISADPRGFVGAFVVVLVLSFVGSALIARLAAAMDRPIARPVAFAVALSLLVAFHAFPPATPSGLAAIGLRSAFQLSLCVLLSFRAGPRRA